MRRTRNKRKTRHKTRDRKSRKHISNKRRISRRRVMRGGGNNLETIDKNKEYNGDSTRTPTRTSYYSKCSPYDIHMGLC